MKIIRQNLDYYNEFEIDFSRDLKFYDLDDSQRPINEHCIVVPVLRNNNGRDEIYFWNTNYGVTAIIEDDRYTIVEDKPKEYARLVNNLVTLFALYKLG